MLFRFRMSFAVSLFLLCAASAQMTGQHSIKEESSADTGVSKAVPESTGDRAERWDKISLADNHLHLDSVLSAGEPASFPTFTRELLQVQWRGGDPIDLYIIRPSGLKKPPVVIYQYSYPSGEERFKNDAFCRLLAAKGMAAVGFAPALTGQRYHDRPMKEWFVSELPEAIGATVHDVQMVLNYLNTRDDLDVSRVGIFGQGSGGAIAILAAAADPRIKAVDVIDPWGDWPDWLATSPQIPQEERATYLTRDFLAGVAPLDPLRWVSSLKGRPFRIQETLFNPAMPAAVRARMEDSAAASADIVEYRDQNDYLNKVTLDGRVLSWLQKNLTAAGGAMATP